MERLVLFLRSWWSRTYNRPLKDPLLLTYTLEELLYEFFDRNERDQAANSALDEDDDKIEDARHQDALDWAEQEERREFGEYKESLAKDKPSESKNPLPEVTRDDETWMAEQLQKELDDAKKLHGDSFGEDINEGFSE